MTELSRYRPERRGKLPHPLFDVVLLAADSSPLLVHSLGITLHAAARVVIVPGGGGDELDAAASFLQVSDRYRLQCPYLWTYARRFAKDLVLDRTPGVTPLPLPSSIDCYLPLPSPLHLRPSTPYRFTLYLDKLVPTGGFNEMVFSLFAETNHGFVETERIFGTLYMIEG